MNYNNSCLLINFGENKKVSDLLKKGQYSIGIASKYTDVNLDLFDAMRQLVSIEQNYLLDYDTINSLIEIYPQYIEQLTRWNISDKCFSDPRLFFDDFIVSLNYWYNFLKYFQINAIYIYEDPHRAYDLLIYVLAKKLNINIYIFSELNTGYRTFIKQNLYDNLLDVKGTFLQASKNISNELKYNHFESQFTPKTNFTKIFSLIKKIPFFFKYQDSYIYSNRKAYIKIDPMSNLLWKFKRFIKTISYQYHYYKSAKDHKILDGDIVFFLHYEPERTSNPLAGNARNQLYCIRLLKNSFPHKRIYVKEHPSQLNLNNSHQNRQVRDKLYLKDLLSISDGIIDKISNNSKFIVATLHGTVGLEYSLKGHNILCFGHAWYDFLQNVYSVKSTEDLKNIKFHDNYNIDKIKKELDQVLYSKSAKGSVTNKLEKMNKKALKLLDDTELLDYIKWYFDIK